MAEEASSEPLAAPTAAAGKMTMVVGVDDSEPSFYALRWLLQHLFAPGQQQYRLVVVTATPSAAVGIAGPGALMDVRAFVESDLKRAAQRVIDKAKDLCAQMQVSDAEFEALEGAPGTCSARPSRGTTPRCSSSAATATGPSKGLCHPPLTFMPCHRLCSASPLPSLLPCFPSSTAFCHLE
ncbi:unnamed protein product [Urochloa humidicola]